MCILPYFDSLPCVCAGLGDGPKAHILAAMVKPIAVFDLFSVVFFFPILNNSLFLINLICALPCFLNTFNSFYSINQA